ncbi:hypothetical protein FB45DRAFT_873091 [Roridomyces roridus]|uniref:Uncharacterized protein n=1 Tax=Roridomyces roridus TaxID=1738132 RepID=A0AAD7BCD2_9AGAR|nr:hypothetical protein FB45DRAFT_873091 [Roridomyces roridus]
MEGLDLDPRRFTPMRHMSKVDGDRKSNFRRCPKRLQLLAPGIRRQVAWMLFGGNRLDVWLVDTASIEESSLDPEWRSDLATRHTCQKTLPFSPQPSSESNGGSSDSQDSRQQAVVREATYRAALYIHLFPLRCLPQGPVWALKISALNAGLKAGISASNFQAIGQCDCPTAIKSETGRLEPKDRFSGYYAVGSQKHEKQSVHYKVADFDTTWNFFVSMGRARAPQCARREIGGRDSVANKDRLPDGRIKWTTKRRGILLLADYGGVQEDDSILWLTKDILPATGMLYPRVCAIGSALMLVYAVTSPN